MRNIISYPMPAITREIEKDGFKVFLKAYTNDENGWILEIVDEQGSSAVWCNRFHSALEALDEGNRALEEEGIVSFIADSKA